MYILKLFFTQTFTSQFVHAVSLLMTEREGERSRLRGGWGCRKGEREREREREREYVCVSVCKYNLLILHALLLYLNSV